MKSKGSNCCSKKKAINEAFYASPEKMKLADLINI
jgi:hypothetical protein